MTFVTLTLLCWPFYGAQLEEYYLGALILAPWNGIVGGSIFAMLLFITSALFGNDFWVIEIVEGSGIRFNSFLVAFLLVAATHAMYLNIRAIFEH